jgi:hypothetical protein
MQKTDPFFAVCVNQALKCIARYFKIKKYRPLKYLWYDPFSIILKYETGANTTIMSYNATNSLARF